MSFTTLFDTGPDNQSLVRNVRGLNISTERVTRVVMSHWHSDHTGGLLSFLNLRKEQIGAGQAQCIVDVHPSRPIARGIAPAPHYDRVICALAIDPTFKEIEEAGGVVEKHSEGHAVAGGTIWVSGEIPRVTEWETGILGGRRWVEELEEGKGQWRAEPVRR